MHALLRLLLTGLIFSDKIFFQQFGVLFLTSVSEVIWGFAQRVLGRRLNIVVPRKCTNSWSARLTRGFFCVFAQVDWKIVLK